MYLNYTKRIYFSIAFIFISLCIFSFFISGTGDDGDSISHYLFAHYAPKHPILYFNHWAKPLFVLLASCFAWAGFKGIVLFNICITSISLLFTAKVAERLKTGSGIYAILLMLFCPLNFILIFSGLTEPLFGAILIFGIYLLYNHKRNSEAAIVLSFLPFVRSEGLLILGIIAFFFILIKQYKAVILLSTGSILYSIAGLLFGKSLLWIITDIPYSPTSSPYGKGSIFHFAEQMFYVTGFPVYLLLCIGIIWILVMQIRKWNNPDNYILPLILLLFAAYFTAHSLSWYFGIFNSMGLKRVLVAIAPLTAIISITGLNFIAGLFSKNVENILKIGVISFVIIFFFSGTPSSIHKKDLSLTESQLLTSDIEKYLSKNGLLSNRKLYYNYPYLSYKLNIDPFEDSQYGFLNTAVLQNLKSGDIVLWDDWYSPVEGGVKLENIQMVINLKECIGSTPKAIGNKNLKLYKYN